MKIIILIVLLLQISNCQKKKSITFKNIDFGDCYNNRETIKVIENIKGKIIKVNDNLWAIQPDGNETQRYGVCQFPEELKKENLNIIFSADIKKIAPNERFAASPINIKELKITDK